MNCHCDDSELPVTVTYYLEGVSIPIIGTFGILGNIAAIYILRQPEMRSSFNQMLLSLCLLDSLYLVMGVWDYSVVKAFHYEPQIYIYLFPYFWYPLKHIIMSWTTFLIMGIATERYLAVCRPVLYRDLELSHSSLCKVFSYTLPALLLSVLLNIPKFLEAKLEFKTYTKSDGSSKVVVNYGVTELRVDPEYIFYYLHWTRLLVTGVLPLVFLSLMNVVIYFRIKHPPKPIQRQSSQQGKAGNLAYILIVIVVVFLVANIPRFLLNLYESTIHAADCACEPVWWTILVSISHLFLTINSSINFLIYCSIGEKFKAILYKSTRKLKDSTIAECERRVSPDPEDREESGSDQKAEDLQDKFNNTETEMIDMYSIGKEEEEVELLCEDRNTNMRNSLHQVGHSGRYSPRCRNSVSAANKSQCNPIIVVQHHQKPQSHQHRQQLPMRQQQHQQQNCDLFVVARILRKSVSKTELLDLTRPRDQLYRQLSC